MTDQGDGVWFRRTNRRLGIGYNVMPVTWQGWLLTLALTPVILATVFAGDPSIARPASYASFVRMKAAFGLTAVHLAPGTIAALIVAEVLAFVFIVLWKARGLRPLD